MNRIVIFLIGLLMMGCGFNTTYWSFELQRVVDLKEKLPITRHTGQNENLIYGETNRTNGPYAKDDTLHVYNECTWLKEICTNHYEGNFRYTIRNFGYQIPSTNKIIFGDYCICE